eukprot:scpid103821/ scgid19110/ 
MPALELASMAWWSIVIPFLDFSRSGMPRSSGKSCLKRVTRGRGGPGVPGFSDADAKELHSSVNVCAPCFENIAARGYCASLRTIVPGEWPVHVVDTCLSCLPTKYEL